MSRAEVHAAQCAGKESFSDMKTARKVAKRRRRVRDMTGDAYRCRFCRGIHIGQPFRGKLKSRRRAIIREAEEMEA